MPGIAPSVRLLIVVCAALGLSGCVSAQGDARYGKAQGWPSSGKLASAAKTAATQPQTWVPLLTAGVLMAADVDNDWSEDLAEDQPLFGSDADDVSDDLRDVATAAYVITALVAPSETLGDKLRGLTVGASTMLLEGAVTTGLKEVTSRDRPDGSNDKSFPSGHAAKASSRTAMAIGNLDYIDMPGWGRTAATWSLHGVAAATGLARVEAQKHHLSDVLAGYALGQFFATFMYEAFLEERDEDVRLSFVPVQDGGALTMTWRLP